MKKFESEKGRGGHEYSGHSPHGPTQRGHGSEACKNRRKGIDCLEKTLLSALIRTAVIVLIESMSRATSLDSEKKTKGKRRGEKCLDARSGCRKASLLEEGYALRMLSAGDMDLALGIRANVMSPSSSGYGPKAESYAREKDEKRVEARYALWPLRAALWWLDLRGADN